MLILSALAIGSQLVCSSPSPMWAPPGVADEADSFVAFRGEFTSAAPEVTLNAVGASEFLIWLDGKLVMDGPARYNRAFPEYQSTACRIAPGSHTITAQVRNTGVSNRILAQIPPYLWCGIMENSTSVPISWSCQRMPEYSARVRRISDILGWIDWADFRQSSPTWVAPVITDPGIGPIKPCPARPVRTNTLPMKPIATGKMASAYGYEKDEIAARFFLDDLDPKDVPPQGVWRRYDLGRVRLGRPRLTLDCAPGTIIEFGSSEQLRHGRVAPWITLSGSTTCNMDHFVASGGRQTFMPFTPKGGRFIEVHIKSERPIKFVREEFLERTWFDEPQGSFTCDDPLLNQIWKTGVETVRACADDTLVDCPTRERGEWTGDIASVAMDITAYGMGDLTLLRRALVHAAQSANAEGLVAGVGPGDPGYLSTYAAQWTTACIHYWQLTGDKSLLKELHNAARRNMAAFARHLHPTGLDGNLGWGFVDWGYTGNAGDSDMALNLHYLNALRAMETWEAALGDTAASTVARAATKRVETIIQDWLQTQLSRPGSWENVGYHVAVLALYNHIIPASQVPACIERIKRHLLNCFPNNPRGPRLSDPSVSNSQLITPYFGHWAMAVLMQNGEADFALDQHRKCWGWALKTGATTWLEVFDTRWSHCHEWSGCPTWQLSRYVLGIEHSFHQSPDEFQFRPVRTKLRTASGNIPFANGGLLQVSWTRKGSLREVSISTNRPVTIMIDGHRVPIKGKYQTQIAW